MDKEQKFITEGSSRVYEEGHVFYNPVQEFNRDVSICVLNTFLEIYKNEPKHQPTKKGHNQTENVPSEKKIRILEALSATGLRSIRYAKEVPGVDEIIANDLMTEAVEMIKRNVKLNEVEHIVKPNKADAMIFMYTSTSHDKRFTAIDVDPYGGPNKFLDAAIQSIEEGGLLLVTATDLAVLAGNTPEACIVKYGSVPLKSKACHEIALRILLRCIEGHANRYGRYIKPLLSLSVDFYARVFVRVYTGQFQCKDSSTKQSMIFQCTGCEALTLQPLAVRKKSQENPKSVKFGIPTGPFVPTNCIHCDHKHHMGGPVYSDKIHDPEFLKALIDFVSSEKGRQMGTYNRILGILSVVQEELHDVPLYYTIDKLCCVLKLEMIPSLKMRSAILHEGYRVSLSHACKNSLKTDAPIGVLWDILRYWAKSHPVNNSRLQEGSALKAILSKEASKEYKFDEIHPEANPPSRKEALSRFPENPAAHWGPGTRSTLMVDKEKMMKSIKNQNKNKKKRERKTDSNTSCDTDRSVIKQMKVDAETSNA